MNLKSPLLVELDSYTICGQDVEIYGFTIVAVFGSEVRN
jgi:hypothetical protein